MLVLTNVGWYILLTTIIAMTDASKPSIKLTYFDIAGRGEPVRLALVLSKTPFEDDRIGFADWAALKPKTPCGQLPVLTIDGEQRSQSTAMMRYIGSKFSETLYPSDKLFDIEEALGLIEDFGNSWGPCIFITMRPENYGRPEGFTQTEEGKECVKMMRTQWLETKLPEFAKYISAMIEKHGGAWIASKDHPTIADCAAFCQLNAFTRGYMDHVPTDCLDKYPTIKAYLERFKEIPEVKEWYAKAAK